MVLGLARAGADVVIASRKLDACEALAPRSGEDRPPRAAVGATSGAGPTSTRSARPPTRSFGRVDVLVNNAGMSPLSERGGVSEELWDKVLGVNLKGPFRLAALVGDADGRDGGGSIVNVCSIAAMYPSADVVPTRPRRRASTRSRGVRARVRADSARQLHRAGHVPNGHLEGVGHGVRAQKEGFALRRGGGPREIVGTLIYLASDASSYTTGALLPVDGGYRP